MRESTFKEWESQLASVSDFVGSETEKIFLVIGSDEPDLYNFMDSALNAAAARPELRVFRYEIRAGEHSKHFLYRWIHDTVTGSAYVGAGTWEKVLNKDPSLHPRLRLLLEQDIRPLEIRFLEAIRFLSRMSAPGERLVMGITPRTSMEDSALVDFFREYIRLLPLTAKLMIAQMDQDVLALRKDFSPSNRAYVPARTPNASEEIQKRRREALQSAGTEKKCLQILSHLAHPLTPEDLVHIGDLDEKACESALASLLKSRLVEGAPESGYRLACPRLFPDPCEDPVTCSDWDRKAVEYYATWCSEEKDPYPYMIHHSVALSRATEPEWLAERTLSAIPCKMKHGWGDICEEELGRALVLLNEGPDPLRARLLLALGEVREARLRSREAVETLDAAIELFRKSEDSAQVRYALELKGRAAFSIRDTDMAKSALEDSITLARSLGREDLVADSMSQLAYVYFSLKQLDEAEQMYRQALDVFRKIPGEAGTKGEASQWGNLGHTAYAKGDTHSAEEYHRNALEIFQKLGYRKAEAAEWGYLGHTLFARREYEGAVEAFQSAARIEEELGETSRVAQRHSGIGHSHYARRKLDSAADSFQKSLDLFKTLGNAEGEAAQLSNIGMIQGEKGEHDQAISFFRQSADLYRQAGDLLGEAGQLIRMAHIHSALKRYSESESLYVEALERYRAVNYSTGEASVRVDLGRLYLARGEWSRAVQEFRAAADAYKNMEHRELQALCLSLAGQAERAHGRVDEAVACWNEAIELYRSMENTLGVANIVSQLGLLRYEQKNFDEAEYLYQEAVREFRSKDDKEGLANALSNLGTLYFETRRLSEAMNHYEESLALLRGMNHPLGIAGLLQNLSYVYEAQNKFSEASAGLRESREIYEHLQMSQEREAVEQRLALMDRRAEQSLERVRAELFPGLSPEPDRKSPEVKVGRNDPCPCGSGLKYKKCCGA